MRIDLTALELVGARVVSAGTQFGTIVILARTETLSDFGRYGAATALAAVFIGLFGFGIANRALQLPRSDAMARHRSSAGLCLAGAGAGVVGLIGHEVLVGSVQSSILFAVGAFIVSESYGNYIQNRLYGELRRRAADAHLVTRRIFPLTAVVLSTVDTGLDAFWLLGLGYLSALLYSATSVPRSTGDQIDAGTVLRESRHYWSANVASMAQQLDVVLVSAILGPSRAAGYTAAFRLASPVHIVTSSITSVMIPALGNSADGLARRVAFRRYAQLAAAYAALILAASPLSYWAGPFLFGDQFAVYAALFPVMLVNSALSVGNQVMAGFLVCEGMARHVARISMVSTLIGISALVAVAFSTGSVLLAALSTCSIQIMLFSAQIGAIARKWADR